MRVAVCSLDLHIPEANSLKRKRQILKSLIQRLRNRYNLSITEIGYHDYWQRSQLGMAVVSRNDAERVINQVIDFVESENRVNIISYEVETY